MSIAGAAVPSPPAASALPDARGADTGVWVRAVDGQALQRHRRRIESGPTPWLHAEVARRMLGRLAYIRRQPESVVDWWGSLGGSTAALRQACPAARIVVAEPDAPGRAAALTAGRSPWWSPRRWRQDTQFCIDADVPEGAAAMLWSNMGLHHVADPARLMQRWRPALAAGGFLMFSTLGPGSLGALRAIYRQRGWPSPQAAFVDMHDLGDMLVRCGFADPVMDQETLTLTWASPRALLDELRQLGGNADPARRAGWRTPRWRDELEQALAATADRQGRIALEFEVVYGHAFKPAARADVRRETSVALDRMRAMLRAGRSDGAPIGPEIRPDTLR